MSESRIYHVLPGINASWTVVREGFSRPHVVRDSKAEAILIAKRLARTRMGARVVVHRMNNEVEREFCFAGQAV